MVMETLSLGSLSDTSITFPPFGAMRRGGPYDYLVDFLIQSRTLDSRRRMTARSFSLRGMALPVSYRDIDTRLTPNNAAISY